MTTNATKPPSVPYSAPPGKDAVAIKRALSRAGYMEWGNFTEQWGRFAQRACSNFQHENDLPATGIYNEATHKALVKTHRLRSKTEWAFDAYSIAIMKDEQITPEQKVIFKALDGVAWSYVYQPHIHYLMARPVTYNKSFPVGHSFWMDCSTMFSQYYMWGGAPDPHGYDYNGYGNTGSLWSNGTPVASLKDAKPMDAVLYGQPWAAGAAAHVIMLTEKRGGVWYGASHGTESGPVEVLATYRPIVGIRRFALV